FGIVSIFSPVKSSDNKLFRYHNTLGSLSSLRKKQGRILHNIADLDNRNRLIFKALSLQVTHSSISWAKQDVTNLIGQNTIDLLWHIHIKTTKASLNMSNRNM